MADPWYDEAPGGAASSVTGTDRILIESSEVSYTSTLTLVYNWIVSLLKTIAGQYDVWQSFTPTNGQTVTINYNTSNSAKIDISALGTGDSITIAVSNWPTSANNGMVSISMKTGADPAVTISWPTGVVAPTLEASKNNRFVLASNFDSSGYDLMSAGAF